MPLITGGFNINASYKGFDMSVLLQGAAKFSFRLVNLHIWHQRTPIEAMWKYRWTEENPDPDALLPRADWNSKYNYQTGRGGAAHEHDLLDGSYLRLKQASFGYTLPKAWTSKIKIDRFRIYIAGTNLITFSGVPKKPGIDPEAASHDNGHVRRGGWFYPMQKTITGGLEVSF